MNYDHHEFIMKKNKHRQQHGYILLQSIPIISLRVIHKLYFLTVQVDNIPLLLVFAEMKILESYQTISTIHFYMT